MLLHLTKMLESGGQNALESKINFFNCLVKFSTFINNVLIILLFAYSLQEYCSNIEK